MTKSRLLFACCLSTTLLAAQGQPIPGSYFVSNTRMNGQDSAYLLLEDALSFMQKSTLSKLPISWDSLRITAREQLAAATCSKDAHPVINWCALQAKLDHSFLMPKTNAAVYSKDTTTLKRTPALREVVGRIYSELSTDGIGYLHIPRISTTDAATCTLLADSLQQLIRKLSVAGAASWIIDLRNNTGGNCWPMIAGLGPLLGEGICGYFVKPEKQTSIRYEGGASWHNNTLMCRTTNPLVLKEESKKNIVVLMGAGTSSAGEILAMTFRGLRQVRFMGEETAGFTTGNTTYTMIDGSLLVLSVCHEADRTGKVIYGKLQPDDKVSSSRTEDAAKSAAIMWLQSF